MKFIVAEIGHEIGTITFNNPEKRNALGSEMLNELTECLEYFKQKKARAVIIRAKKGVKVWSAGHDISELAKPGRDPLSYDDPLEITLRAIEQFPAPVIALIEGSVWGGACELAFTCDIIVAGLDSTFAITPAKIGVPYNSSGLLHFTNALGSKIVKEMFFTAKPISAQRAEFLGVVNHTIPEEDIEDFVYNMALTISENSPLAITAIKEQLRMLSHAFPMNPVTFEKIQGLRRRVYGSEDYKEGIEAFLEKRKPVFKG